MGKKVYKPVNSRRVWLIPAILFMLFAYTNASVTWQEMSVLTRSEDLEQQYNTNSEYKQRYILKYLPNWLETRSISGLPGWAYDIIEDALYNAQDGLHIAEAVILTKKYGLSEFYERLIVLYREAHTLHANDADNIRSAVVSAIDSFGGTIAEYAIPELLLNRPRFVINKEFSLLLSATARYCDTTLVPELEDIEQNVSGLADDIDEEVDPVFKNRYLEVLSLVRGVKQGLLSRGGGDD